MKLLFLACLLPLALAATAANAETFTAGPLRIEQPWSRATPKGASVAGGYLKVTNTGSTPDRLIGGSSDAAARFEIHEMSMDGGVMKMRALKDGLAIPPGATVELKPGSYHAMFVNLTRPFVKGDHIKGSLTFEKAGKVDVDFVVEDMGGRPAAEKKMHSH